MMSRASIRNANQEAAERAAQEERRPIILEEEDRETLAQPHGPTIPRVNPDSLDEWEKIDPAQFDLPSDAENDVRIDTGGFMQNLNVDLSIEEFAQRFPAGYGYGVVFSEPGRVDVAIFERIH